MTLMIFKPKAQIKVVRARVEVVGFKMQGFYPVFRAEFDGVIDRG